MSRGRLVAVVINAGLIQGAGLLLGVGLICAGLDRQNWGMAACGALIVLTSIYMLNPNQDTLVPGRP